MQIDVTKHCIRFDYSTRFACETLNTIEKGATDLQLAKFLNKKTRNDEMETFKRYIENVGYAKSTTTQRNPPFGV